MNLNRLQMSRLLVYPAVIIAAFTVGALWRGGGDGHRHDAAVAGAPATKAQTYYCSMHPQVRSPDPNDKCPICFMDLIPLPDDDDGGEEGEAPRLRVSARAAALMDIRTWPVERRAVEIEVRLFGQVDFDASRLTDVPVRTEAYIERLVANTPWQPVAKGETLAEVYSPAAVTAMRELLVAGRDEPGEGESLRGEGRNTLREAVRARLLRMGVSAGQIAEIEQGGEAPRTFRVVSPVAGVVQLGTTREGEWLREGARLVRIADVSRVWVNLEAYERDLPWLATGMAAHFHVAGLPGQRFEGVVAFVAPVLDPGTRTVRLRVEVDNPDGTLIPGMFVSAVVQAAYTADARRPTPDAHDMEASKIENQQSNLPLVVPATAPLITGKRALVYVRIPGEDRPTFEPRRVTLGPRAGDHYVVEDGLAEGELVVVNGAFRIDSELQIRGRPSMMTAEGKGAGGGVTVAGEGEQFQTECPVMGGAINPELFVDVEGHRIYVCCPGCDDAILEDPQRFLDKMAQEGVTPYRLQTHCPIMDFPINRDLYHDHAGLRLYICCPGCLDEVRERADEIIEQQRAKGIVFEKRPDTEG